MTEPIQDPNYWKARLDAAQRAGNLWHSVFCCGKDRWSKIEAKHREILARVVHPGWSVLDAGCGYGRLLDLMPDTWHGYYLGVDSSPAFIDLAREMHNTYEEVGTHMNVCHFLVADLRMLPSIYPDKEFDLAVMISVRPMVVRNMGQGEWDKIEAEVRRVSKRLLYLEYDPSSEGSVE